jgi:hypothetical protein
MQKKLKTQDGAALNAHPQQSSYLSPAYTMSYATGRFKENTKYFSLLL